MELMLIFLPVSLFGIQNSNAKFFSENDIYISNSTTYNNIPTECRLLGIDSPKQFLVSGINLNITTETSYWIGAKIEFPKKFNPLGEVNKSHYEDKVHVHKGNITVQSCANKCIGRKYFVSDVENTECVCLEDNVGLISNTFKRSRLCPLEDYFCHSAVSVLYENNISETDYKCEEYRKPSFSTDLEFQFTKCLEKKSNGFLCGNGGLKKPNGGISWYAAYQRCKEIEYNGSGLLRQPNKDLLSKLETGLWYWVSFLRRPGFIWGKDFTKTVCVAARIQTNGSYRLESQFCNKTLEALCYRHDHKKDGSSISVNIATVSGSAGGVVVFLVGIIAVIFKKRCGHLPNIQTPPQEDLDISSTSTGRIMIKGIDEPLYSNSDDPVGDLSIYSLAMAYSELGNNKDTPDKQYDSVTYKEPRNTDEDNHYDHIMENHYQNPYS